MKRNHIAQRQSARLGPGIAAMLGATCGTMEKMRMRCEGRDADAFANNEHASGLQRVSSRVPPTDRLE